MELHKRDREQPAYKTLLHHPTSQHLKLGIQKVTHIHRADLQVQKLNINDEATMKGRINWPNKVFAIPKQSLMNYTMMQDRIIYTQKHITVLELKMTFMNFE